MNSQRAYILRPRLKNIRWHPRCARHGISNFLQLLIPENTAINIKERLFEQRKERLHEKQKEAMCLYQR